MFTHLPEHLEGSWTLSRLFVFPHHTMTRENGGKGEQEERAVKREERRAGRERRGGEERAKEQM